jgi:hypothetical protein
MKSAIVAGLVLLGAVGVGIALSKRKTSSSSTDYEDLVPNYDYDDEEISRIAEANHDAPIVVEAKISALSFDDKINNLPISDFSKQRIRDEISSLNPEWQARVFEDVTPQELGEDRGNFASAWQYAHGVNG